jgi:hypothetical protein
MATYYNWWGPTFFYKLIYLDSMGAGKLGIFLKLEAELTLSR